MYSLRILNAVARDLAKLDKPIARRISQRIRWLAENLDSIHPQSLKGDLAGLCKLREGDYHVLYQVLSDDEVIIIHEIGHRRDIYRKR